MRESKVAAQKNREGKKDGMSSDVKGRANFRKAGPGGMGSGKRGSVPSDSHTDEDGKLLGCKPGKRKPGEKQ